VSIEVQCPNPDCAQVHRVKNRWAGRRGTCPDCGAIIEVPEIQAPVPSRKPASLPEAEPEPVAAEVEEDVTVSDAAEEVVDVGDETVAFEPPSVQEEKAEEEATVVAEEAVIDDPFAVVEEVGSAPAHSAEDPFVTEVLEDAEDAEVTVGEEAEEVVDMDDETVALEPPPPPKKEKPGKKKR
jgi:hypothetical protein